MVTPVYVQYFFNNLIFAMKLSTFFYIVSNGILILLLTCCANQNNGSDTNKKVKSDSFVREVPKAFLAPLKKKQHSEINNKLGLGSLENGFKELQIRIWRTDTHYDTTRLLILTNNGINWTGCIINFKLNLSENLDSVLSVSREDVIKAPKTGWNYFIDSVLVLGLLDLPDYVKLLPEYEVLSDGDGVTVEYANTEKYRIYGLPDPQSNEGKFVEARKMLLILRLIEDEFDIKGFSTILRQ